MTSNLSRLALAQALALALVLVLVLVLVLGTGSALAHDSWLSPSDRSKPGSQVVELSTGTRYPAQEFNPTEASLVRTQCSGGKGQVLALRPLREQPKWLELAAAGTRSAPALACWVELKPFELVMQPDKVVVYFNEIRPTQELREAWKEMLARGVPWQESYRKFARIELASAASASPSQRALARRPVGMDLEIVVLGDAPIAVGQPLEFQVLREGRPLAGFPVELVSERNPLGIWRETDSEGRLRHVLPFSGRWLLRGTDLRPAQQPDRWTSLFVTLAIETGAAAPVPGQARP